MLGWLRSLFDTGDSIDNETQLRELFRERENTLALEATFGKPVADTVGEPTVQFPATVRTTDGELYDTVSREFRIPDNGTSETDSPLVTFLATELGIDATDVTVDDIFAVEGDTVDATLANNGSIELDTFNNE